MRSKRCQQSGRAEVHGIFKIYPTSREGFGKSAAKCAPRFAVGVSIQIIVQPTTPCRTAFDGVGQRVCLFDAAARTSLRMTTPTYYSERIGIRVTTSQREHWERAAAKHRRLLTDWIRIVCDDQALRDCPPEDEAVPVKPKRRVPKRRRK